MSIILNGLRNERLLEHLQLNAEKYEEAVKAYKKSLRLNPEGLQTRRNLSYAQKQLLQQQQQKDQQYQKNIQFPITSLEEI